MAAFEYIALNERGREQKGVLEADSSRHVRQILRDRGLAPLSVETSSEKRTSKQSFNWFRPSLSVSERALITRQLATLIAAGLPVEEGLLAVSRQTENTRTQKMLAAVRSQVMEGYSLANSFAEYPNAFPISYRATVAAGESAGHLDLVMDRLADFTESQQVSRAKIQQAAIYPIVLFTLTLAILAGLLGYVVPDIVEVFSDTGQELPFLTTMIIAISDFVVDYGLYVLVLIVLLTVLLRRLLKVPGIRLAWDRRLLHLPVIARLSRGINASQFSSTLSILSSSGVPLIDAMSITGEVLSNTWLKQAVSRASVNVSEGSTLNAALEKSGYFPPMMLHMIASGESSGELDEMLKKVAAYMQQDVELLTGILLSLFGPLMLLIVGCTVFIIVMAILLPIINLNQLIL